MSDEAATGYTFGDTSPAGDRLELVAQVFDPTTAVLLRNIAEVPSVAVDLGCGPGHTTRLIASTTGSRRTVGLDQSAAFIERARAGAPSGVEFLVHDVTATPLPIATPELLFARYLLAHLIEPLSLVDRWCAGLAPRGHAVFEEVEHIDTTVDVFRRYLDIVTSMMASRGGDLYIGATLGDASAPRGCRRLASDTARIEAATSVIAQIFTLNLATWRTDPWVVANVDPLELREIEDALHGLRTEDSTSDIAWTHRHVIYERV